MAPAKTSDKPADPPAEQLLGTDAPTESEKVGTDPAPAELLRYTVVLGNGETVQADAPVATQHYGTDDRLWPVLMVVANPPAEEV